MDDRLETMVSFLRSGVLGPIEARIDTHAAVILLGEHAAYKLKRPVRYSFLDFTTLACRERAIRAELALNRRNAPMLYRRVFPVLATAAGTLALDGAGAPVEWVLEMARFPAARQLDRVAESRGLDPPLLDALAAAILRSHEAAEVTPEAGGARAMAAVVDGNREDLEALVPDVFDANAVADLADVATATVAARAELLDRRRAAGLVRHCHGDLHLRNIVLLDEGPVLFDCIEFDPALARIDLLYDLAFLVMDLIDRGLRPAAHRVLQAYLERRPDDEGLALLPLFLSSRAAIRAKVEGFAARISRDHGARELALGYLALARDFLRPPPPVLLAIGGLSGTGKSTLAYALAPAIGAPPGALVLRSDLERKRLFGVKPTAPLPAAAYAPEVSARVFAELAERAGAALRAGHAVICDAVYGMPEHRSAIEATAAGVGVPFHGLWLEAPLAVLEARVAARANDASDADVEVLRRQARAIDPAPIRWRRLPAEREVAELARAVTAALAGKEGA